ncbi:MAG TPA: Fmu (Sun) domain-containing protein [Segetibacter sp.]
MSRLFSHINTSNAILKQYKGNPPLSSFLKNFFAQEKKYGSGDRKAIASLCYNYFRTGRTSAHESIEKKLAASLFLYSTEPNEYLQKEKPGWNDSVGLPLTEKLALAGVDPQTIFPFNDHLCAGIDQQEFNFSFLIQPELFIRIRPGKKETVKKKLLVAQTSFYEVGADCLAFTNGTRLEHVLQINREFVVQDLNSQRVGELFPGEKFSGSIDLWDCCAASGGKSIMAYDLLPKLQITVSDVRNSIIHNLQSRFREAEISSYRAFVTDVTDREKLEATIGKATYDIVICDAPCSGSGTWSRTPEQLSFFNGAEITRYSKLQKTIASNTIPYIKKKGYLLYITCSVFKEENEEVVQFLQAEFELTLIKVELFKGYKVKADTMFAALFQLK